MNSAENSGQRTTEFFLDTYALIEVLKGNRAYTNYFDVPFSITKLNLFELHHYLLREKGDEIADRAAEAYIPNLVDYGLAIIKKASKFRTKHKQKDLSMTDCVGYIFAIENGLLFVTGDKGFKDVENVDFISSK